MNLEHLPTALITITVLIFLLIGASMLVTNYALETFKQKANSLTISCSEAPTIQASKIEVLDQTIYCKLT